MRRMFLILAMLWLGLSCMPGAPCVADTTTALKKIESLEKLTPAHVARTVKPQGYHYWQMDEPVGTRHRLVGDDYEAINLWSLFVYYWPHWGALLVALYFLIGLFVAIRVWRRPREPGRPYCRKCNYCLSGTDAEKCPECGAEISGRGKILGKSLRRRLITPGLVGLLPVMIYGVLILAGAPQDSELNQAFSWWSKSLMDWADKNAASWLQIRSQEVIRYSELDINTGQLRTLIEAPDDFKQVPSHDGRSLLLIGQGHTLRLRGGQSTLVERLDYLVPRPPQDEEPTKWYWFWMSLNGRTLYRGQTPGLFGPRAESTDILAYDLATGRQRKITNKTEFERILANPKVDAQSAPGSGLYIKINGEFMLHSRFTFELKQKYEVLDAAGALVSEFDIEFEWTSPSLYFSTDGSSMCLVRHKNQGMAFEIWDLRKGKKGSTIKLAKGIKNAGPFWLSSNRRFVIVLERYWKAKDRFKNGGEPIYTSDFYDVEYFVLYDLHLGKPVATLDRSSKGKVTRLWFDTQARTFYMLIEENKGELTVEHYDLTKFVKPAGDNP